MTSFDIGLDLEGTHVVITGAAGQIGQQVVEAFLAAGALVSAFDIDQARMTREHARLSWQVVDITDEEKLEAAFEQARLRFGTVVACCAVAGLDLSFLPHHETICDLPLEQWQRTLRVNTTGTFLTARTWLRGIREHADANSENVSLVVIGSEAGCFGVPGSADYATSKAAIQYGLVKSIAPEAVRIFARARVNAIAPGPVHTPQFDKECAEDGSMLYRESQATMSTPQSIPMSAVARMCLMLVSEKYSESVTAQTIRVDGGKSGRIMWEHDGRSGW